MKSVVITGASGFLGGALALNLLKSGVQVYGVGVTEDGFQRFAGFENFVPIVAEFSNYSKLSELILGRDFDVFYHFAWQGVFGEAFKDYALQLQNARYACEALMQAKQLGCKKFVLAGTYNEFEVKGFMEDIEYQPRYTCIYASAKLVSELMCRTLAYQNNLAYNAGLVCMAYGENNYSGMLPNVVLKQLLKGEEPKLITGDNYYDMVYVDDVAKAFAAIGERGINQQSYYIGHRKLRTFRELLSEMRDIVSPKTKLHFGAFQDTAAMDYNRIDLEALYRDTGFECQSDFKESIMKTAEWLKEHMTNKNSGGGVKISNSVLLVILLCDICLQILFTYLYILVGSLRRD